ncbi:MAG: formylglycine-generating enzyme family protein [Opitutaceae bacterium]|jgi:formylglycine-generating enzyme required for sulfatase activity|nr:formylglycine-generating enzyme family protein [Opitutaceae bacterium]
MPMKTSSIKKPKTNQAIALLATAFMLGGMAGTAIGDPSQMPPATEQIGGVGNAPDTVTGHYGKVDYEYQIGTYEVTNAQYVAFLNAVKDSNPDDPLGRGPLGLYHNGMKDMNNNGIVLNGSTHKYEVTYGFNDKPVTSVTVYAAMRFVNWLTNGAMDGASTETGVYTLLGGTAIPTNPTVERNVTFNGETLTGTGALADYTGTVWALPSEDEWYKAAYYNVSNGSYSLYPNGKNDIDETEANYAFQAESPAPDGGDLNGTMDVNSYQPNPNGLYNMAGNVIEWTDTRVTFWSGQNISEHNARALRGGSFNYISGALSSSGRLYGSNADSDISSDNYNFDTGFRVVLLSITAVPASVPEPGTYAALAGLVALLACVAVRRHRHIRDVRRN